MAQDSEISRQAREIQSQFEKLLDTLETRRKSHGHAIEDDALSAEDIEGQLEKYNLWMGNLGVHHAPHDPRSLEYRLRDAPAVRCRAVQLLGELQDMIREGKQKEYREMARENTTYILVAVATCTGDTSTDDLPVTGDGTLSDDEDLVRELSGIETSTHCKQSWWIASISDTISRLFKFSTLLAKSTTRDRYVRAEAVTIDKLDDHFDVAHTKAKFAGCKAEDWLLERLGKAITKRRMFFLYCREHRYKLSRDTESALRRDKDTQRGHTHYNQSGGKSKLDMAHTIASAVQTKASTLGAVNLTAIDSGFDDNRSFSTLATTVHTSPRHRTRVPDLSDFGTFGEPFECPYCRVICNFSGPYTWK